MGTFAFKLPDIGEGVVEGEVVEWMVSVGDTVKEDDPILSVMTDKATVEIPSPVDGKVTKVIGEAGDILPVGVVCIEFEVDGDGNASASEEEPVKEKSEPKVPEPTKEIEEKPAPKPVQEPKQAPQPVARAAGTKALASPAVRQRAREANINLEHVAGSGPAGRISHADLDKHISGGASGATSWSPIGASAKTELNGTEEIKVIGLRRKIADSMMSSYSSIAHFSYFEEVDITALEELRQHLNSTRPEGAPKLTYLPFIMQALVKALRESPECNALYDDDANVVTRYQAINLGIATQTDRGLYVPVVKHVEAMDIWQSAAEMVRVTSATREGKATAEELSGSTFTITSLGRLGGLGATPIINKPEVGILGVHNAKERAVVRNGHVVVRRMMNLSSSWDHRVVDGHDGATLVQRVKTYLENPATIFM
ncbi:MAG: dihydrolipoamide acetyltransferase family protein [Candidatus Thermoplasmatota archaeon]|nr:branched-chain alpha-keto acid dehydrogenase subunit E2 [Euryarchaeota archaeon]MBR96681.1 branched-chain alpha-keto acid dehydrogenase subunit E2 [Euryarchaeota archaeon]MED5308413.1 dihydrolipoamide acetyltransferase family protein [Candidatus Thermoplasmatota archaeon]|tara:strand:- start:136 stop:1413 length:1278 start_codon:yes stop_codon:yes gene_type:complete